jgi:IMP dehydrogenase
MAESKLTKVGYELEDVNIIKAPISFIEHRSECDPMIEMCGRKVYPVIVAPMGAVTDENNYMTWLENGFICVVPRTVDYEKRIEISKETFASFSLSEAEELWEKKTLEDGAVHYICIDIAHGTMQALYQICHRLTESLHDNVVVMTGNVAVPEAYDYYSNNRIDFMRACIGTGSRCITTSNVGIHYPTATLIDELIMEKERKEEWDGEANTEIIVDGGIHNFDDIQKCLCLGAFAVMSGSIFAKAREACESIVFLHPNNLNMADAIPAEEYYDKLKELKNKSDLMENEVNEYWDSYRKLSKRKPYRLYYGMSTKKAQRLTGGSGKVTSEGFSKPIPVEYPIAKWAEDMADYMRSCMSYTGCRTIQELRDNTKLIINGSGKNSYWK